MKHIFIVNPVSGHQEALQWIPWIETYFKDRPTDFAIHVTQFPGHATQLAAQYHLEDDVTLYSCGGDGTANEVVNGLAPGIAMAILPSGTGNDFFRMAELSHLSHHDLLIQTIEGKEVKVDIGIANGKRFLDSATMGFDADVGIEANRMARNKWIPSKLVYLSAVLKILTHRQTHAFIMDFNQQTLSQEVLIVAVMNGRFYGGGFLPTPMATIQDGLFDVCVIENTSLANILRLLPKYMKGTHIHEPIVRFYNTDAIKIQATQAIHVQTDGEIQKTASLDIRLLKQGLKLRVPMASVLKETP